MTPLDPRPWPELSDAEQLDILRIAWAVREWNRHLPPVDLSSVKTRKGRA